MIFVKGNGRLVLSLSNGTKECVGKAARPKGRAAFRLLADVQIVLVSGDLDREHRREAVVHGIRDDGEGVPLRAEVISKLVHQILHGGSFSFVTINHDVSTPRFFNHG